MKIVVTGGGTGGHAMPIVSVVQALKNERDDIEFLWIGSKRGIESSVAEKNKINFKSVSTGKLRRYFSFSNVVDAFKIPIGVFQSYFTLKKFKPDVIFGKGGFVSIPAIYAGSLLKIPIILHESDITPGLANKIAMKYASKVAVSYAATKKYFKKKAVVTGNPSTTDIIEGSKKRGVDYFSLDYQVPTILVIGGSQGAKKINDVLLDALPDLLGKYQVIHVVGKSNVEEVKKKVKSIKLEKSKRYNLYSFLESAKMGDALASANLIISRAGANALSEIAIVGKPSILIPLSSVGSRGDQIHNANFFEKFDAAKLLPEDKLTKESLLKDVGDVLENESKYNLMAASAAKLARPEASKKIATEILKLADGK